MNLRVLICNLGEPRMRTHTRRGAIVALLTLISTPFTLRASRSSSGHQKVSWIKMQDELLRAGDFWASHDPNTPERQGEDLFNLILHAVHPNNYGVPASKVGCNSGGHWRPVGLVDVP
jgi:hypothetical protein